MSSRSAKVLAVWLGLVGAPAARADPPAIARQEIDYLLRHIGDSGCEFKRNGAWSNAQTAEAHVRGKYDFLVKLNRIDTAKDFIDKAATGSSLSGQPYEIKCGADLPMPSSLWLNNELARYRTPQK